MVISLKSPILEELTSLSHAFTTRQGGVSLGLFTSLNAAIEKQDDLNHVKENRRRIAEHLGGVPDKLVTLQQSHTNKVVIVDEPWEHSNRLEGDALVTNKPDLILGIITADCVPILLADPEARVIAAVHAGWQGATTGIIKNTLTQMKNLGAHPRHVRAAIGPCIWQESYEVDQIFYEKFPHSKEFFVPGNRAKHWQFDLPGYALFLLSDEGINQITPSPANTYTNEEQFFSFRRKTHRNEPVFGCSMSAIMIRR